MALCYPDSLLEKGEYVVAPKKSPSVSRTVALGYIRQSYTRDADDTNSPERQEANIRALCEKNGWTLELYKDADGHKSGRYEDNRPQWLALKARLSDPDIVALVSNDLSRLHRKGWRVGDLVDFINKHNVSLVLAAPGREVDTSTPMGRIFILFSAIFDEYYAEDMSQRQKDNVAYRRQLGKSVGIPPFGTGRDREGYLKPSRRGAWYLPNDKFQPGHEGDEPPMPDALWRGYYACAERILRLYAEGNIGVENIAYRMNQEHWAFRTRHSEPRPITKDDVRRVVSNWRSYAGLTLPGRAKELNASMIDNPLGVLYDTGRSVFDIELIRRVAEVQLQRSVTLRPIGSKRKAHAYPLTGLLYCAHCEQLAEEKGDPKLRSRIAGWKFHETHRYRHTEGRVCPGTSRSISTKVIEDDFYRLVQLLSLKPEAFPLLTELALQAEFGGPISESGADPEREKQEAIAKCKRRVEAARHLYEDGDLSREEYLRRKEQNEREIAHWEARTTETEKEAMKLAMCMDALAKIVQLWEMVGNEDKQGMARYLFDDIIYDLDSQRIVNYHLKPWAAEFLVVRAALYERENEEKDGGENGNTTNKKFHFKSGTVSCPQGGALRILDYSRPRLSSNVPKPIIYAAPQQLLNAIA